MAPHPVQGDSASAASLACLANAVRARDELSAGRAVSAHERNVSGLAMLLAGALGLPSGRAELIGMAAAVHDIGKLTIPDAILLKPGLPTPEEWTVLRHHARLGEAILAGHGDPLLDLAATIARSHHEAYDGSGYPDGLSGEAIPAEVRIVAICDVYDALRQERAYKPALDHRAALDVMTRRGGRSGTDRFDPAMLSRFVAIQSEVERTWAPGSR